MNPKQHNNINNTCYNLRTYHFICVGTEVISKITGAKNEKKIAFKFVPRNFQTCISFREINKYPFHITGIN